MHGLNLHVLSTPCSRVRGMGVKSNFLLSTIIKNVVTNKSPTC